MSTPRIVSSSLAELFTRRALLVTGKGGVGKTTIAATLARVAAAQGTRVLCAEVAEEGETRSPLGRAFGCPAASSEEPTEVAPGIRLLLLTPTAGHRQFLADTVRSRFIATRAMKASGIRAFLAAAPTFPEMGILYRFLSLLREERKDGTPEHELVVVDLPATGHALAFAQFPAALLRLIPGGPVGKAVRDGLARVTDPAQTAALVVTLCETLPVSESLELVRGLTSTRVHVAAVVLNRLCRDLFEAEEREAVDRFVAEHAPLLGARSLTRIDLGRAARARLERELDQPIHLVEESAEDGPRVPLTLAATLLNERVAS